MYSFYRRRAKHPCGRCNYECTTECIKCVVCNKWLHHKCLNMTEGEIKSIDRDTFFCSKKCEFSKFPFHSIGDKDFLFTNAKRTRFQCIKCKTGCHKKLERLQCKGCLKWIHLQCSQLPAKDYSKYISNETGKIYFCSIKSEMNLFPF